MNSFILGPFSGSTRKRVSYSVITFLPSTKNFFVYHSPLPFTIARDSGCPIEPLHSPLNAVLQQANNRLGSPGNHLIELPNFLRTEEFQHVIRRLLAFRWPSDTDPNPIERRPF